ncbi:MAG: electron transfer flavoprotein subunit alpha/FixB family protein [Chloroflexota bacterium]|nr:MAG: electron transfer flavoprotein subunit alpha/FixB family protein [Chloroflexota bacterium]
MSQDIYVVIEHLRGQVADISYMMLVAGRALSKGTGGDVVGVLLGHDAQRLASDLAADRVLYLDHLALAEFTSDGYQEALSDLIEENSPRAVLFGSTSIGADIASVLSARLDLPLVNLCRSFNEEGRFISQICGGKIMAEGDLPGPTALVTMLPGDYAVEDGKSAQPPDVTAVSVTGLEDLRVTLAAYIEPETADVDIAKEPILISVGRGVQTEDNIELVEELAEMLGGVICASRPVVDQGWLPTSRMVGKSGQSVKPKLYLAMGISGAPEHVEGITESEMVIAINTDPDAPIFDVAQYGAEVDMLDLTEVLIEQLEEIEGG